MCSVSDDIEELDLGNCSSTDGSVIEELSSQSKSLNVCKKCGEASVVVLQKKDPFCKQCFLIYCNHKFRATIGRSKKIKTGSKVLVCHSGGLSSTAMLHMVLKALQDTSPKRLVLKPGILYISESCLTNHSADTESEVLDIIQKAAQALHCEFFISSIDMAFREGETKDFYWSAETAKHRNYEFKDKLAHCLDGIKTLSSKQELLVILRKQLMVDVAESSGYSHLFFGDSATSLANDVLASIAFGRGSQVSENVVFQDTRHSVSIYRPLREFLKKELAFYNQLNDLKYFVQPSLLTMTNAHSSIQRLTEKFVSGLQENFPATVFTIFRTGGKVAASHSSTNRCLFCESPLDNVNPPTCSALEAMELTAKLSRNCSLADGNLNVANHSNYDGAEDLKESMKHCICHGCQVLMNEMTHPHLPTATCRKIIKNRTDVQKEIKSFLLNISESAQEEPT